MMKGDKLNQPMHTGGHTLSPSSCTHFSLSNMKSPWKDLLHHAAETLSPLMWHGWTYSLSLQLHQFFPFKHKVTMKGFTSPCCWNVMSTGVERLELQSLKFAEMLCLLMLRLELQNMKISHHILSSNLYY